MYFWWYWNSYQIWKKNCFSRGEGTRKISIKRDGTLKETMGFWTKVTQNDALNFSDFLHEVAARLKNWAECFLKRLFMSGFWGKNPPKWTWSEEMEAWHSAISRELLELVYQVGYSKSEPRKLSSTLPKSFFFVKQIINSFLLCEIYHKLDILNA